MVVKIENQLKLKVISSTLLSDSDRNPVLSLCNRAYEEDLGPLFNDLTAHHSYPRLLQTNFSYSRHVGR